MITTEVQYQTTLAAIRRFEAALAHADDQAAEYDPNIHRLLRDGIEGEMELLRAQAADYEARAQDPPAPATNPGA